MGDQSSVPRSTRRSRRGSTTAAAVCLLGALLIGGVFGAAPASAQDPGFSCQLNADMVTWTDDLNEGPYTVYRSYEPLTRLPEDDVEFTPDQYLVTDGTTFVDATPVVDAFYSVQRANGDLIGCDGVGVPVTCWFDGSTVNWYPIRDSFLMGPSPSLARVTPEGDTTWLQTSLVIGFGNYEPGVGDNLVDPGYKPGDLYKIDVAGETKWCTDVNNPDPFTLVASVDDDFVCEIQDNFLVWNEVRVEGSSQLYAVYALAPGEEIGFMTLMALVDGTYTFNFAGNDVVEIWVVAGDGSQTLCTEPKMTGRPGSVLDRRGDGRAIAELCRRDGRVTGTASGPAGVACIK